MSGEAYEYGHAHHHWFYAALEEGDIPLGTTQEAIQVLGAICREMAWGKAGDSCFHCAKLRASAALDVFFEDRQASVAMAVARDHRQNRCERCRK